MSKIIASNIFLNLCILIILNNILKKRYLYWNTMQMWNIVDQIVQLLLSALCPIALFVLPELCCKVNAFFSSLWFFGLNQQLSDERVRAESCSATCWMPWSAPFLQVTCNWKARGSVQVPSSTTFSQVTCNCQTSGFDWVDTIASKEDSRWTGYSKQLMVQLTLEIRYARFPADNVPRESRWNSTTLQDPDEKVEGACPGPAADSDCAGACMDICAWILA